MLDAVRSLVEPLTATVPHGRWSLHAHLEGTARILEAWGAAEDVVAAGLLHSIYGTDVFRRATFAQSERERVRAAAGERAERLAWSFGRIPRGELRAALGADDLRDLAPMDAAALALIHAANLAEQSCAPDGSPAAWLALAAHWCALARRRDASSPDPFGGRTPSADDERDLLAAYRDGASALRERAIAVPYLGEPHLVLAAEAFVRGDRAACGAHAVDALRAFATFAVAWDKRLSLAQWTALAAWFATSARDDASFGFAAERWRAAGLADASPEHRYAVLDAAGALALATLPPRFAAYVSGLSSADPGRALARYPGLRARPWWDDDRPSLASALESHAAAVIAEIEALDPAAFVPEAERIVRSGTWNVIFINERGRRHDDVRAVLPLTTRLLDEHGAIDGLAGLAYVSRLAPGARVAPHRGPTNMRIRLHLGIRVPEASGIRVGGEARRWRRGEVLAFDDGFEHEAWNDAHEERIVLIVDVWHPDLASGERRMIEALHRYIAQTGANLQRYWAANERAAG